MFTVSPFGGTFSLNGEIEERKKKVKVKFTGVYGNLVRKGSLSKLDGWSTYSDSVELETFTLCCSYVSIDTLIMRYIPLEFELNILIYSLFV